MSTKFSPTAVWRMRASPGPGLPTCDLFPDQNFGTAGFVKTDGMRHGVLPSGEMKTKGMVAVNFYFVLSMIFSENRFPLFRIMLRSR